MSSDRGNYIAIYRAMMDDPDFRKLHPLAKLMLLTLKLVLGSAGIAVLWAHVHALAALTGLEPDEVSETLDALRRGGWLVTDGDVLWLRNALRYNPTMNVTNAKHRTAIRRHLLGLPRCDLVEEFCEYYGLDLTDPSKAPSEQVSRASMKKMAQKAVYRAVKSGALVPADKCERCGADFAECKREAHHADYSADKRLDVEWLCTSCHAGRHAEEGVQADPSQNPSDGFQVGSQNPSDGFQIGSQNPSDGFQIGSQNPSDGFQIGSQNPSGTHQIGSQNPSGTHTNKIEDRREKIEDKREKIEEADAARPEQQNPLSVKALWQFGMSSGCQWELKTDPDAWATNVRETYDLSDGDLAILIGECADFHESKKTDVKSVPRRVRTWLRVAHERRIANQTSTGATDDEWWHGQTFITVGDDGEIVKMEMD